jgi:hypothetical protein
MMQPPPPNFPPPFVPSAYDPNVPERVIGEWRRSMTSPGFWLRVIFSLTLYYWLYWERNKIVLTNRRITQHIAYLIGGEERSMSLHNVTEVRVFTPPLGTLLGFANVQIQSMGGDQSPEIRFDALERAAQLKQMIFAVQDQFRAQGQGRR